MNSLIYKATYAKLPLFFILVFRRWLLWIWLIRLFNEVVNNYFLNCDVFFLNCTICLVTFVKPVGFPLPCSDFHLFMKLSLLPCKLSVSVRPSVCSDTAVSVSASGGGDKWHPAPLALIERCQRSVSSCCHRRLCSRTRFLTSALRFMCCLVRALIRISKNLDFQEFEFR